MVRETSSSKGFPTSPSPTTTTFAFFFMTFSFPRLKVTVWLPIPPFTRSTNAGTKKSRQRPRPACFPETPPRLRRPAPVGPLAVADTSAATGSVLPLSRLSESRPLDIPGVHRLSAGAAESDSESPVPIPFSPRCACSPSSVGGADHKQVVDRPATRTAQPAETALSASGASSSAI